MAGRTRPPLLLGVAWCCCLPRLASLRTSAVARICVGLGQRHTAVTVSRVSPRLALAGARAEDLCPGPERRETIYAVSSGSGVRCGVAVIRISGPAARSVVETMTAKGRRDPSLAWLPPRTASLAWLLQPHSCERLDSSLILWFPAPRSFTGEDTVELHVHGGRAVVGAVLDSLSTLPGLRMAERGEFTRRAYMNGRMGLTEVEGLSDLLAANTDAQRRQALAQMDGAMRGRVDAWRAELLDCLAHAEAVIDFGEDSDDLSDDVLAAIAPRVEAMAMGMRGALAGPRRGEMLREGPRVVIVGAPNAGKSSLLNKLAQRPAAIVTPIAGTTRDVLEVELELGGYPLRLCDTAGLRDEADADEIEIEGMRRARALAESAATQLVVIDISAGEAPTMDSLLELLRGSDGAGGSGQHSEGACATTRLAEEAQNLIVALNKVDAAATYVQAPTALRVDGLPAEQQFVISCKTGEGVDELVDALERRAHSLVEGSDNNSNGSGEAVLITRARHREHMGQALAALDRFSSNDLMVDLAAEELRIAAAELGKVTGVIGVEEVLDVIFRDFCIGK